MMTSDPVEKVKRGIPRQVSHILAGYPALEPQSLEQYLEQHNPNLRAGTTAAAVAAVSTATSPPSLFPRLVRTGRTVLSLGEVLLGLLRLLRG